MHMLENIITEKEIENDFKFHIFMQILNLNCAFVTGL